MNISQVDMQRRLSSSKNLLNQLGVNKPASRGDGDNAPPTDVEDTIRVIKPEPRAQRITSPNLRATAGVIATVEGVPAAAATLGITRNQARSAKNTTDPVVRARIDGTLDRVQELALDRLMETLGLLTNETLVGESPKNLAYVATSLAKVSALSRPREEEAKQGSQVQLVVFAPAQKTIKSYDIVDL